MVRLGIDNHWHPNPEHKPQGLKIPTLLSTGLFVPNITIKPPSEWVILCYQCLSSLFVHWPALIPELWSTPWVQTSGSEISYPLVNEIIYAQPYHYTAFWVGKPLFSVLVIINSTLAIIYSRVMIWTMSTNVRVWNFPCSCQLDFLCPTSLLQCLLSGQAPLVSACCH